MAAPTDASSLAELLASTLALLSQFSSSLGTTASPTAETILNPPNPLHVLRDSANLLKAHTTKLSLLTLNAPFTPSAVVKVLRELATTCLPAMMGAVQICEQEQATWGTLMGGEVQARVRRVFREMEMLLREVQAVASGNSELNRRRDSLSSTGVVWESCDALAMLEKIGIAGLAVQKAEQYRDTIKDAIAELREWAEGEDLDSEGHDALLDDQDEGVGGDGDSLDDLFNAANSMPKDRPELRALIDESEGKLKKVVLLYGAIVKRRLKTFVLGEAVHGNVARMDDAMRHLQRTPHLVDESASYFYDLDEERVRQMLESCVVEAKQAGSAIVLDWEGKEDALTTWIGKWNDAVG